MRIFVGVMNCVTGVDITRTLGDPLIGADSKA